MEIDQTTTPSLARIVIKDLSVEIAEKVASGEYILAERLCRSDVWLVYARIMSRDGQEIQDHVFCKTCERVFKCTKGSISNLKKHKCYTLRCQNMEKENSINDENSKTDTFESFESSGNNNLRKLLTRWIIKECLPYDVIQSEGLKAIFQEIARIGSKFDGEIDITKFLPSFTEVSEDICEIYEQCFETVKAEIASIKDNGFGLSTDIWINKMTKQNYMALAMHYLKNGVLIFRLLGLQRLEGESITYQNVIEKVEQILDNFDCKMSGKTILVMDGDIVSKKDACDVQIVPCLSQLLRRALLKSIEAVPEVATIISNCSNLVNLVTKKGAENLLGDLLKNSSHNHWLKINKMLKSVERNWSKIEIFLQQMCEKPNNFVINIQHLQAVVKVFQPFEEAIDTLEDDSSATLHLVIVFLHELRKICYSKNDIELIDFKFVEHLKANISDNLEKIVKENFSTLHKIAIFLYPPTNQLLQFNDEEKKCIEGECVRLMQNYKEELKPELPTTPISKRCRLFADFVESETTQDPNTLLSREIQFYKKAHVLHKDNFDVFNWWEQQRQNFPLLYKLSCIVLATPATCSACKKIFVGSSNLVSDKAVSVLKDAEIEKIVFINSNADLKYLL